MNGSGSEEKNEKKNTNSIKGVLYVLLSAVFFSLGSVLIKLVTNEIEISSLVITFIRFSIGFLCICPYTIIKRKPLRPVRWSYIILRAVTNTFAIMFFFIGVQYTTVTKANMLNMTSPVFVFLIAPFINKEKPAVSGFLYLAITMIGVYLVVSPRFSSIARGDVFALASGVAMAIALSALREARKHDEVYLIMFYLYIFSTVIMFFIMLPVFVVPPLKQLILIILSGFTGILGQATMSRGFKFIDAASGSLVSASRIIMAGIFGVFFFADPLVLTTLIGGVLILVSLIGVSGFFSFGRKKA